MRILIADDDRVSLMMMRRMLQQSGYDVCTAGDGRAAVDRVAEPNGPRLLLLDWMMPSMSGPEVCRAIRAQSLGAYVYIVLLTAKDTKEDLIAGLEAGADDFLIKPCHPEELQARLRTGQRILRLEDGLVEARDEMHFRATHDALTRILNRGAIVHSLGDYLADPMRVGSSAVLLCDVDHFKHINDTYGHPVGDEVLGAIARRLQSVTLSEDKVGRFGGEEFLLLLHDVSLDHLDGLGHNICELISSHPVETSAGPLMISLSVGVLGLEPSVNAGQLDEILSRTDQLLYRAKREGRARAVADTYLGMPVEVSSRVASFPPALMAS